MYDLLGKKHASHRSNAAKKNVGWLTLDEYREKVNEAGIALTQIGMHKGCYQLSRYNDSGDYTPDSCRFITKEENIGEMKKNGGVKSASMKKRGRTADTHTGVAKMAEKKSKEFSLYSPTGEKVTGRNLCKFCREHGLNQGNLVQVKNGHKKSCKGWTLAK